MVEKLKKFTIFEWVIIFAIFFVLCLMIYPRIFHRSDINNGKYVKIKGDMKKIVTVKVSTNKGYNLNIQNNYKFQSPNSPSQIQTQEEKKEVSIPKIVYDILGEDGINSISNGKMLGNLEREPDNLQNYVEVLLGFIDETQIDKAINLFNKLYKIKDFERIYKEKTANRCCSTCCECDICRDFYSGVFLLLTNKFNEAETKLKKVTEEDSQNIEANTWLLYLYNKQNRYSDVVKIKEKIKEIRE